MNFMLTCVLFFTLSLTTSLASHVEYVEPPTLHRTVHVIRKVHAPIVKHVEHHVQEVPVPVPVAVPVETHVPVAVPVAVEAPVVPVVEELDPISALVHKVKAHLLGKRSLEVLHKKVALKKDVVASKAALLHRKFDYLAHRHD